MAKVHFLKACLAMTLVGASSSALAQKKAEVKPDENTVATLAVEKLLNSIRLSSCDFDVVGSSKEDKDLPLVDQLNLDCMAYLSDKSDLEIPVMGAEKNDGFGALVRVSTKNIYVHLTLQQDKGVTKGLLKFYSGYDKQKGQWVRRTVDVGVAVLNGNKVMNGEVMALQLSEARVTMVPTEKDSSISVVKGDCVAQKKVFHLGTLKDELKPAECRFEGLQTSEGLSQFNFVFKSIQNQRQAIP